MRAEFEFSWRDLLSVRSADMLAIADMRTAKRVGAILWLWGAAVALVLLPLAPPDRSSLGDAGWPIAIAIVVAIAAFGVRLLRASRRGSGVEVEPREILAFDYLAIAFFTSLNLLSDDASPYEELLLIATIYTAGVFAPRTTGVYMVFVAAALAVPLLGTDGADVSEQVSRWVVWTGLAMAASAMTSKYRLERAALMELGDEARHLARADPLTGLGNRRAFDEAFGAASARAARTESSLSVIIADIEAFKAVNDGYGLDAGDRLLQEVAATLGGAVREPDACFRWGGDEFVVLADIGHDGAVDLGRRIGEEISRSCARPDGRPVRMHVGIAELAPGASDPDEVLGVASRAMKREPNERG